MDCLVYIRLHDLTRDAVQTRKDKETSTAVRLLTRKVKLYQFPPGLVISFSTLTKISDIKKRKSYVCNSFRGFQSVVDTKASWWDRAMSWLAMKQRMQQEPETRIMYSGLLLSARPYIPKLYQPIIESAPPTDK